MEMKKQVQGLLKQAMLCKDPLGTEAYRAILTTFTNLEKGNADVTELDYLNAIKKMKEQRLNSAKVYRDNNRIDLATIEEAEVCFLEQFIPEMLSEAQIACLVEEVISENNFELTMRNMGNIVKLTSLKASGRADGKVISTIVKGIITK